jgi:small subunit ribosomal protein S20
VAHSLSAKKRVRQNLKHRARNRARKTDIRDAVKTFTADLTKADFGKAEQDLKKAVQLMDRVATKGTIHKNAAARKRSRLTRRLNAARAAASKGAGTRAAKA